MNRTKLDALFVINQDVSFSRIKRICIKNRYKTIFLLTTHYLYENERKRIADLADYIEIRMFADFLTDEEMFRCDKKSSAIILACYKEKVFTHYFSSLFTEESLFQKNSVVYTNFLKLYEINDFYYCSGLGVSDRFWRKKARCLSKNKGYFCCLTKTPLQWLYFKQRVTVVFVAGMYFIFLSPVNRLHFTKNIEKKIYSFLPLRYICSNFFKNTKKDIICRFIDTLHLPKSGIVIGSTVHGYDDSYNKLGYPLRIFIDGYYPPNYSRSYIDRYPDCEFSVRDYIGEQWFFSYGKKTVRPPIFLQKSFFKSCSVNVVKNVLLVLNHAGDWSALINRSDTDILIEAIVALAKVFKHFNFIIRLHPTMAQPEHEGIYSVVRIKRYLEYQKITNLSISNLSLAQDLQRADLYISEYSQVLLDAIQAGKLGTIANLTRRRSFMQEYEALGFLSADNYGALENILYGISHEPARFIEKQNIAIEKYNTTLSVWYERKN